MFDNESAMRALREAVRLAPDNVALRSHFASLLLQNGQMAEAEREYRAVIAMQPGVTAIESALAAALYRQGKLDEAAVLLRQQTTREDCPAQTRALFARILRDQGELTGAREEYRRAVAVDPRLVDEVFEASLASEDQKIVGLLGEQVYTVPDSPGDLVSDIQRPKVTFADVGGMESIKEQIRMKIVLPFERPDVFQAYGQTAGGGLLMYGPPGCGKSYIARATAGEIKAGFLSVAISDVLDMWLGKSEQNLHSIFRRARERRPCVLFFDEVDALAAKRTDLRLSPGRNVINQFLAELDGVTTDNEGVLVLASTNAPWFIDSAFRRPGRFDRVIFVPPPDVVARAAILRLLCRGKPAGDIDFETVAKKTDGYSGADLKGLVSTAVESKIRQSLGARTLQPLETRDLLRAAASLKPTLREWFEIARNYATFQNDDGQYEDLVKYLDR